MDHTSCLQEDYHTDAKVAIESRKEGKKVVGSGWAGAAICGISTRPPVFTWLHTPTVITLAQGATQKYITLTLLHIIFTLLQKTPEFTLAKRVYWRIYSTQHISPKCTSYQSLQLQSQLHCTHQTYTITVFFKILLWHQWWYEIWSASYCNAFQRQERAQLALGADQW